MNLSGSVQYEKWLAPLLASGPQTNWTSSFQITFWPKALHHTASQSADADNFGFLKKAFDAQ
jgi:hypothetical protein